MRIDPATLERLFEAKRYHWRERCDSESLLSEEGHYEGCVGTKAASRPMGVTTSNTFSSYLEPCGLAALWPKLSLLARYAATGLSVSPVDPSFGSDPSAGLDLWVSVIYSHYGG